jgi:hypothetical protein
MELPHILMSLRSLELSVRFSAGLLVLAFPAMKFAICERSNSYRHVVHNMRAAECWISRCWQRTICLWNSFVRVSLQNTVMNVLMMVIGSLLDLFLFLDIYVLQNVLYILQLNCVNFHIFVPVRVLILSRCYGDVDLTAAPLTLPAVLVLRCRWDWVGVCIAFNSKCLYEAGVLPSVGRRVG